MCVSQWRRGGKEGGKGDSEGDVISPAPLMSLMNCQVWVTRDYSSVEGLFCQNLETTN